MPSHKTKWLCFLLLCIIGYIYLQEGRLEIRESEETMSQIMNSELDIPDPMEKTVKRIKMIKEVCGDLCDTSKEIEPGEFVGSVTAKVDCKSLFQSPILHHPGDLPPQAWEQLPSELKDMYTYNGRLDVQDYFLNTAYEGIGRNEATVFTKEQVEKYITAWKDGKPIDTHGYWNASNIVSAAADYINVTGLTVLVVGTQDPWLEAVLLSKNPKKVVTLEYGYFISEYPGLSFIRMEEFREQFLNGTMETFDAVFTFSSVEHSGQGRYGDPLNPWGDILAMAQAWCVSKKQAKLAIGTQTMVSRGSDLNAFNAHRIYGPVMYPFLATNWKFEWPTRDEDRVDPHPEGDPAAFQPVFVFEKVTSFWG